MRRADLNARCYDSDALQNTLMTHYDMEMTVRTVLRPFLPLRLAEGSKRWEPP
jgi:hypothetical protein